MADEYLVSDPTRRELADLIRDRKNLIGAGGSPVPMRSTAGGSSGPTPSGGSMSSFSFTSAGPTLAILSPTLAVGVHLIGLQFKASILNLGAGGAGSSGASAAGAFAGGAAGSVYGGGPLWGTTALATADTAYFGHTVIFLVNVTTAGTFDISYTSGANAAGVTETIPSGGKWWQIDF